MNMRAAGSITALAPTTAPIGYPFDIALATTVISGVTPAMLWMPPIACRQPQETSSKIRITSYCWASACTPSR